jgi:hypothetical protein
MKRVTLFVAVVVVSASAACEGSGRVEYSTSSHGARSSETARPAEPPPPPPQPPPPVASAKAEPPRAASEPSVLPGCSLVCNVALRKRVPAADEARFAAALADPLRALHACARHGAPPMTLRFDSAGALTYFGVEEDEANEHDPDGCASQVRGLRPSITYAGPSTVRCAEQCRP